MRNAGEDYWPWLGRSPMRAQPLFAKIKKYKVTKSSKAVAGLEKVILVSALGMRA